MGPLVARIKTNVPTLARDIALMYADFPVCEEEDFSDFHVEVAYETGVRRWIKPQVRFFFDGQPSFIPLPADQALAMLEWGMNWCVAAHCHQYLIVHAAVLERGGRAVVLPAPPGSGKSTLCAALALRGWRLLSDELALYDSARGTVCGMARPINLKNQSIEVIQQFSPLALMSQRIPDTTKGTVALLRPPVDAVLNACVSARPCWIVLPQYAPESPPQWVSHSKARTFMLLAEQSFNYDILGERGFDAIGALVDQSQCFHFTYSRLEDAIGVFDDLLKAPLHEQ
jgi:HprK-related kinase A